MTPEEIKRRIESLQKRTESAAKRKAELQGELRAREGELRALLKEITDAGYNPKELVSERDRVQAELISLMESYEAKLVEVEKALATYTKE
jgi:septal ring factor EnvC (AmiA/AmiB activator)